MQGGNSASEDEVHCILMKSLVHTEELCSWSKIPRVYRTLYVADRTQVPVKNSVKQLNRRGPKPIVLIKNKSSLIFFSVLSVNLLG